jgi:serine/threonine protein kinase
MSLILFFSRRTPAYASPENFCNVKDVSFTSDVWSLAAALFHLVSGELPFAEQTTVALSVSIAGDLDKPTPDIRDRAPEEIRSNISSAFAAVIAKGMEKRAINRYQSVDEFASDLHGCLVKRGEGLYSVFISYRVVSEKYHAMMLYDVLNNTTTPAGHRIIVYLDIKRLVKGEDWEEGFSLGLLNSLVALPLLSAGVIEPLTKLSGSPEDREDNVAKELIIMQALQYANEDTVGKLETIYPVIIGKPLEESDPSYPYTGNFFTDGSSDSVRRLAAVASPSTMTAVARFLQKSKIVFEEDALNVSVASTVKDLFALQGAQLWNHPELEEEDIQEDSELWLKVSKDPPSPPMNLIQLRMLKAELRALVPGIHEVIDRAHAKASKRRQRRDAIEERRLVLLNRVILRMSSDLVSSAFEAWQDSVGDSKRLFQVGMRRLPEEDCSEDLGTSLNIDPLSCLCMLLLPL